MLPWEQTPSEPRDDPEAQAFVRHGATLERESLAQAKHSFPSPPCCRGRSLQSVETPQSSWRQHFLLWHQQHFGCFPNLGPQGGL